VHDPTDSALDLANLIAVDPRGNLSDRSPSKKGDAKQALGRIRVNNFTHHAFLEIARCRFRC